MRIVRRRSSSSPSSALSHEPTPPGDVGAVVVGRYGDPVGIAGDPLANVRLHETPVFVKGGTVVPIPKKSGVRWVVAAGDESIVAAMTAAFVPARREPGGR